MFGHLVVTNRRNFSIYNDIVWAYFNSPVYPRAFNSAISSRGENFANSGLEYIFFKFPPPLPEFSYGFWHKHYRTLYNMSAIHLRLKHFSKTH